MNIKYYLIFFTVCFQDTAMPLTNIEDRTLKELLIEHVKSLAEVIIMLQDFLSLPGYEHKISQGMYSAFIKIASLLDNQTLTQEKSICWEFNELASIGTRLSQEETGLFLLTIYSEKPSIESSTYSIDESRIMKKVNLSITDTELIKKQKHQKTKI